MTLSYEQIGAPDFIITGITFTVDRKGENIPGDGTVVQSGDHVTVWATVKNLGAGGRVASATFYRSSSPNINPDNAATYNRKWDNILPLDLGYIEAGETRKVIGLETWPSGPPITDGLSPTSYYSNPWYYAAKIIPLTSGDNLDNNFFASSPAQRMFRDKWPNFVSSISISPPKSVYNIDDYITVTGTITNTGDGDGAFRTSFKVANDANLSINVGGVCYAIDPTDPIDQDCGHMHTLAPGASKICTCQYHVDQNRSGAQYLGLYADELHETVERNESDNLASVLFCHTYPCQ